ncbi:MAG: tRNA (cytidine(34)-2'-O)-methyltransferase [Chthoniobacter sp.]|uniref:tRNA (cytidine(34)-2'-O)-methyltransferase n=1 Tax=Chthoniobacter sp. TaxID=2510640 RepID=UPI0032AB566F
MLHVVLVEPEIPPNTGNIGRLCLATDSHLHLVKPLGFSISDKELKRAGLDYWKDVRVSTWESFAELQAAQAAGTRYFFLTTKTQRTYWDAPFRDGDFLVFGRETKGLPEPLLEANRDHCLTIPMTEQTRSLNLATAVGIVLYEAVRQTRFKVDS